MMWAFRPRPRWQRRRGRQGRSCLEAGDSRLNFAPYCDVISFVMLLAKPSPAGAPEGWATPRGGDRAARRAASKAKKNILGAENL